MTSVLGDWAASDPLGWSGVLMILAGAILQILLFLIKILEWKRSRQLVNERDFVESLRSSELNVIGEYLRSKLGSVSVESYLNDETTQRRVNLVFKRLGEIVNQPLPMGDIAGQNGVEPAAGAASNNAAAPPPTERGGRVAIDLLPHSMREPVGVKLKESVEKARIVLRTGRVWDALALLRHEMEATFLALPGLRSNRLDIMLFDDAGLVAAMAKFLRIANRAIHGDDVSASLAEIALQHAERIAEALAAPHSNVS